MLHSLQVCLVATVLVAGCVPNKETHLGVPADTTILRDVEIKIVTWEDPIKRGKGFDLHIENRSRNDLGHVAVTLDGRFSSGLERLCGLSRIPAGGNAFCHISYDNSKYQLLIDTNGSYFPFPWTGPPKKIQLRTPMGTNEWQFRFEG